MFYQETKITCPKCGKKVVIFLKVKVNQGRTVIEPHLRHCLYCDAKLQIQAHMEAITQVKEYEDDEYETY